ncbi:hypothetical protein E4T44_03196 [Aureobasidium sp. EXF-8845]|nr:hypothetical protein E4T44_03196 [Aureobasidium sp. EXF-8845]
MSPFFNPRDRHSNGDKGPKSLRLRRSSVDCAKLANQITSLKEQISERNVKIVYYRSLHNEHISSIQQNITPYIRCQMEHEEAGRGIRKGSQYQMYLMINLRVRVQFLRDMASHWMEENASDEQKIRDLEKEMGLDQDVLENCEDAEREQKSSLHEVQGKAKTLDEGIGLSNYEEKNGTESMIIPYQLVDPQTIGGGITWNLIHYARRFHLEAQDPTTKSLDNLFSFLSVFHHLIAGSYDAAMYFNGSARDISIRTLDDLVLIATGAIGAPTDMRGGSLKKHVLLVLRKSKISHTLVRKGPRHVDLDLSFPENTVALCHAEHAQEEHGWIIKVTSLTKFSALF